MPLALALSLTADQVAGFDVGLTSECCRLKGGQRQAGKQAVDKCAARMREGRPIAWQARWFIVLPATFACAPQPLFAGRRRIEWL